jgi:2-dehydro-3-deoxyglucarate aldolase/4-hydroxy-2-oxoheptanedioate aldolase
MIETKRGLEAVDEIAAVPGVDALHLGQFDLSLSLGMPGQFGRPEIQNGIDAIVASCRRHGKTPACMAPSIAEAHDWMARGFRMVSYSYDMGLMVDRLREGLTALKG